MFGLNILHKFNYPALKYYTTIVIWLLALLSSVIARVLLYCFKWNNYLSCYRVCVRGGLSPLSFI